MMAEKKAIVHWKPTEVDLKDLKISEEEFLKLEKHQIPTLLTDYIDAIEPSEIRLCSPETVRHNPKRKPRDKR